MRIFLAIVAYFLCIACAAFGMRAVVNRERWLPFLTSFIISLVSFMILIC
jgi:hypothetical protein